MRIAVVCDSINMMGGSSVSAKRFIRGLTDRGHEIMLITNSIDKKNIDDPLLSNVRMEVSGNIPIIQNDKFAFSNIDPFKIDRLFNEFKPELVYSIYPTSFSAYRAVRSARRLQIPVIGHFHVQIENISEILQKLNLIDFVYKLLLPLYNKNDMVLCPSLFAQQLLSHHGIKIPTEVVSNGVDLNRFKKLTDSETNYIYEKFSIEKNKFNVLYIGRLDKEKDMMTLLQGFKKVQSTKSDAQLIIGGIGCDFELIKNFIAQNNLSNSVKLLGRIPDEDIVQLYNIGNVFVSASFCELEGMTLLEAMACGLPLIVSDADTSAARFLINNNGLTFKSKDHVDLSAKIINLYEDKSILKTFAQQSLKNSLNYNFENSVDKLESIFSEAVCENGVKIFLKKFLAEIQKTKIDVSKYKLDHVAYLASSKEEYESNILILSSFAGMVHEAKIAERRVAVFKLRKPIIHETKRIIALEIIEPKPNQKCESRWEHGEFVIDCSYEDIMSKHPNLDWDTSSCDRPLYSHLKLKLTDNMQLKFHKMDILKTVEMDT